MIPVILQKNIFFQYADLIYRIIDVKHSEQLERISLDKLRRDRFEELLQHVFKHSDFYNDLYRSHGITPKDIPDIKIEDLPIIDKQIMMDNYDSFVCDKTIKKSDLELFISNPDNHGKKYKGRYQVILTSGSTGHIGFFIYDIRSWNITKAMAITRVSKAKLNPLNKIKLAFIGVTDGHYAGISLSSNAPKLFYDFEYFSVNKPEENILEEINRFQPNSLCGYSSSIHMLADEQLHDKLNIKPKSIICSADQMTDSMRSTIKEAFNVNPRNFYAASESLCMAAECDNHKGLHLFEDWHCYEVVDSNFQAVNAGKSGSLLLTTLHNYTQPLIRYQIHDEIILDPNKCNCGRSTTLIKKISGRSEEFLWFELPDGKKEYIHPEEIVGFFVPGIEKYQLEQTHNNHLLMRMIINGDAEKVQIKTAEKMDEILSEKNLNHFVTFSTEVVEDIAIDSKTGKFKLILPYKN